jgi:hypothetical protein
METQLKRRLPLAEKKPQTLANHAKFDPLFHFFQAAMLLLLLILTITNVVRNYESLTAWILVLLVIAVLNISFRTRIYALKAQDRVIRLEERLRLASLLQEPLRSRIGDLTEPQLIAIRFASDGEVAALVQKTLTENLKNSDIKKSIASWRPDYFRI